MRFLTLILWLLIFSCTSSTIKYNDDTIEATDDTIETTDDKWKDWPKISINEDEIKSSLENRKLDLIEGIWSLTQEISLGSGSTRFNTVKKYPNKYKILIIQNIDEKNKFNAYIMSTNDAYDFKIDRTGFLIAEFEHTAFDLVYQCKWYIGEQDETALHSDFWKRNSSLAYSNPAIILLENFQFSNAGYMVQNNIIDKIYNIDNELLKIFPRFDSNSNSLEGRKL